MVTVAAVSCTGLLAHADPLTDQRERVQRQIAQQQAEVTESSQELNAAAAAVGAAQGQLSTAKTKLRQTRVALATAQRSDQQAATELIVAQLALSHAQTEVVQGQADLDAEFELVGQVVRDQYQQQSNLLPLAMLTGSSSMGDFSTRVQWSTTMFDTTQATIDDLTALQAKLTAKKAEQTKLEKAVAADRVKAARQLTTTTKLKAQAERQTAAVAASLRARQVAERAASTQLAADQKQYTALKSERVDVDRRIAARVAAQRAAAEKASRVAAAQTQRAAGSSAGGSAAGGSSSGGSSSSGASHGFSYPVSAPITSPYGMRLHPVLHVWKLHDGTDFGAGCGTPIRAAYSGTVAERYFNAGYGNRLMIDHGQVDGHFITTGYNHAISYTVNVGQHVSQGQVIGYVGTTGYSTGCHLHLMVWEDGTMINPMNWF